MEESRPQDRRHLPARRQFLAQTKAAVANRIRRVCAAMTEADFDRLVTRIAEIDLKYRLRQEPAGVPSEPTAR